MTIGSLIGRVSRVRDVKRRFQEYDDLANISEIGRRYFAMNAFDGILTIIGVPIFL